MEYSPSEVLIHTREPFNKNSLWIQPTKSEIKFNIYDSGKWRTIYTTKDEGLSSVSLQQVYRIISILKNEIEDKITKSFNKNNSSSLIVSKKQKELELKIQELEEKIDKLTKYTSVLTQKIKQYGGK